ncbi:VCBS repeat-containing protein, partial [bacterium]|nr:VCBS repeat-containing protein [bacterium]
VYGLNSSNEFISVASYTEMGPNSEWAGITAGDFNNNGIDEIAAVSNQEGKFYVYKLNSLNQFVEIASDTGIGLNADWAGITSGNFDNDEADEIAAVSNQEGNFYVYKLNFLNQLVEIASYTGMGPNSDWRGICAGNFESDNADEIVAVRNFDNDFYIYNVDGSIFTRLGQEHFPVGFENNILGSGKCSNGTQDDLIIARNSDGDIGLFSINAPTTPVFMTDPVQESAPIESDLALQNQTVITDNVHFAANTITTGPAYTIENNAHMIFVSGNTITLQDGFHAKNGCEFYATVDPQLNNPPPLGKRSACANIISDQSQDLKDLDIKSTEQNGVDQEIPTQFSLSCNRPNPFNPITVIPYALPEARCVRLVIYNMMGQKVRTLVDETKEAGFWQVNWDCCDDRGQVLSSGVYICLIEAGEFVKTRKMVLLR